MACDCGRPNCQCKSGSDCCSKTGEKGCCDEKKCCQSEGKKCECADCKCATKPASEQCGCQHGKQSAQTSA